MLEFSALFWTPKETILRDDTSDVEIDSPASICRFPLLKTALTIAGGRELLVRPPSACAKGGCSRPPPLSASNRMPPSDPKS